MILKNVELFYITAEHLISKTDDYASLNLVTS